MRWNNRYRDRERLKTAFRTVVAVAMTLSLTCSVMKAQADSTDKEVPATRHLDLPLSKTDTLVTVRKSPLPKIDLPEYTITGKGVIDLPDAEKQPAPDDSQSSALASVLNPSLTRTRGTAQSALGTKENVESTDAGLFSGTAFGSIGTFFSPQAGLWFGQTRGDYTYSLGGQYYRTEGWAPYTDRSGGSADISGSTRLKIYNPYFDQSRLSGELKYSSDTYNWYGTSNPRVSRNRVNFDLSAGLSNWDQSPIPYKGEIGIRNFQVVDSSNTVSESRFRVSGTARVAVSTFPLLVGIVADAGSVFYGGGSSGLSLFEVSAGSQRYSWNNWSLEGLIHAYLAHGMDNQSITRLYPNVEVAYRLSDRHTLSATYSPSVEPGSLASEVFANRYLSALSTVKYADDQQDVTLAAESGWSAETRTRFAVRFQSIKDYPLYADSLSRGVWLLAYGGRTTITSFSGEIFAKLPANDYFSAQLVATISRNSLTGGEIPYFPVFQVGASYTRQFFTRWTGIVNLTLIHERTDNVVKANTLPSILLIGLRGEYAVIRQVAVFLDVKNLLNQQYEYWRGYQEEPFVLSAGVTLRW